MMMVNQDAVSRITERMMQPTPKVSSRMPTDGIVEQPAATRAATATNVNMGSVCQEVQRLDLLTGHFAIDANDTEADNVNHTMAFKVRQHRLGTPAVVALECSSVDLIQLLAWVGCDEA
jgi:hypothetical protein